MRQLGAVVASLIQMDNIKYFLLVQVGADYSTSLPYDITMANGVTYYCDNGLIGVEPPRLSSVVDRTAYKVLFGDPNFLFRSYFEDGAVGDPFEVRVGFVNSTSGNITGSGGVVVKPGEPFKNMADTIVAYKGVIDSHGYEIGFQDGEVRATIEGSSPMADLDLVRSYYTSKDFIKQIDPTDTAYDQIYEGSSEIVTKWGKA